MPETPVTKEAPAPARAPAAKVPAETKRSPYRPLPAEGGAGAGATIQLGAFSSQAGANSAWKALSRRFSYLAPLSHSVTPVDSGGKALYRLRARGPDASGIRAAPRVAREAGVRLDQGKKCGRRTGQSA